MTPSSAAAGAWTCPFCPLACDHLRVAAGSPGQALSLQGGHCERASQALARFGGAATAVLAEIDGRP